RRMARPDLVDARVALGGVAHDRTVVVPGCGLPLLVAGDAALAERADRDAVVDAAVSVSCDAAVRRSVRLSRLLRSRRLPRIPLDAASPSRLLCLAGSAVRRGVDVDRRDALLPRARCDTHHAAAVGAESVVMTQLNVTALTVHDVHLRASQARSVLLDYW